MSTSETVRNGLVGALVSIVLAAVPFSTILGGALAGFLQGSNRRDAAVAGGLSGAIVAVPFVLAAFAMVGLFGVGAGLVGARGGGIVVVALVFAAVVAAGLTYTVVLGTLGGYLGAVLAADYPDRRGDVREAIGLERDERARDVAGPSRRFE